MCNDGGGISGPSGGLWWRDVGGRDPVCSYARGDGGLLGLKRAVLCLAARWHRGAVLRGDYCDWIEGLGSSNLAATTCTFCQPILAPQVRTTEQEDRAGLPERPELGFW